MAGGVLERLQLNHKQRRIQKRLKSLFGLMRTLLGERSASALLAKVASVCKELLGVERVSLFQVHPATKVRWGDWRVWWWISSHSLGVARYRVISNSS